MIEKLNRGKEMNCSPSLDFDSDTCYKLQALNYIRKGGVGIAAAKMNISLPENFKQNRRVVRYERNKKRFKLQMRQIARDLKKVGL